MANIEHSFRINTPVIAYEYLEDEVVILNLGKDRYYSTENTGLEIWRLIEKGCSKEAIIQYLKKIYHSNQIEDTVTSFIVQLQAEEILQPTKQIKPVKVDLPAAEFQKSFVPPVLEVNEHMHDLLLLLEPVQEIEEMTESSPYETNVSR